MIKCSEALGKIIERRKRYFTPDEMKTVNVAHGKLIALEEMEKQGRLVILPCKLGDTLYYIDGGKSYKAKAILFRVNQSGIRVYCERHFMGLVGFEGIYGKTVFLTREEAEAAINRMESEEDESNV